MTQKLNLKIRQGETFQRVIRWMRPPYIYKMITAITQGAPVQLTVPGHELTNGWPVAVVSCNGMEEINAQHSPPWENEFHQVTVIDVNTITINDINAADFSAYKDGGYLQFLTPVNIEDYSAEMDIKDRVGGKVLMTLASDAAVDPGQRIVVNNDEKTISLTIPAQDLAADLVLWESGVHDLEMQSPTGQVTTLYSGSVSIIKEVTTNDAA